MGKIVRLSLLNFLLCICATSGLKSQGNSDTLHVYADSVQLHSTSSLTEGSEWRRVKGQGKLRNKKASGTFAYRLSPGINCFQWVVSGDKSAQKPPPVNIIYTPDTLILIDRSSKLISHHALKGNTVFYKEAGKSKLKEIERDKVFSVRTGMKTEKVLYVQDTLENNWLTEIQMRDYIRGQQDARHHYGKRANFTALGGFVTGGIGAGTGLFYGPLFIIGYTGLVGFSKPSTKERLGYNPLYLNNEYYREGFGTMAKRMSVRRSAIASSVGYIVGVITLSVLLQ